MVKNNAEHWLSYKNYTRTWTKIDRKKVSFACIWKDFGNNWKNIQKVAVFFRTSVFFLENKCDVDMFYHI